MKSTEKLIQECLDYKRSSQNELYHRYADHVMSIARRYLHDQYKSKDVFLRAFEKAFNNISKFDRARGSFKSWISKITINEAINYINKEKRLSFDSIDNEVINVAHYTPAQNIDIEIIKGVIDGLKMPYGLIFNMVQDGYKHKEIAMELNITEATSRSYYKRSREMIKNRLAKNYSSLL